MIQVNTPVVQALISEFGVEEISSDEAKVTEKANNAKI
ncbi:hypothetical protein Tco_0619136, partial [Tanacetum coccineum]